MAPKASTLAFLTLLAAIAGIARAAEGIIPAFPERGIGGYTGPAGGDGGSSLGSSSVQDGTGTSAGGNDWSTPTGRSGFSGGTNPAPTDTTALLQQTSFGDTAYATAQQLGVNVNGVSAIGYAESKFQNTDTQLGTSNATGPWQFVPDTFTSISNKYGLGYTAADITNPDAQAVEASYLLRDTANTITATTQQPATVLQTYMGWVFGPQAGAQIAAATSDTPLSSFMPGSFLANNKLPLDTTVGQINAMYAQRLGSAANQIVLTSS
ncbi:MAG: transglycosylase SLT domain-containing protein [Acetobacteraceae bacterium]|nr:transglycosylase SLT domain-containing protein [Acetobacteraceae bacterium]